MIIEKDKTINILVSWINQFAKSRNKNSIICVATGGLDSSINALLCLKQQLLTNIVFMGFKQNEEDTLEKYIIDSFDSNRYRIIKPTHPKIDDVVLQNVDIRSSLIPTYVNIYANMYDSLSVGSITRSEYNLVKFFNNRIDDCFDCYPIIDLYKSEIKEIAEKIYAPKILLDTKSQTEESFGFTYDELEWLDREDVNLGIVSSNDFPNKAKHWALFNNRNRALITKVFQMKMLNKHKFIANEKKCQVRALMPGLVT